MIGALRDCFARLTGAGGLRVAFASNFLAYGLAVVISLATFRLTIVLTDTPTVGLWGLVHGLAVTVGVTEMGLMANLTRFVAARGNASQRLLRRLAAVGAIMCLVPALAMALLIFWPIYRFAVTRPDLPTDASAVAWLTGLALALTVVNVGNAIVSGLAEGLGRLMQRSSSFLVYNAVAFVALWPAVALFGPSGIGAANFLGVTVQFAVIVTIFLRAARRRSATGEDETIRVLLRTLFASTMQSFGSTLARLSVEPVARFYVALGGSLTVQAWFELAMRVGNQARYVVAISLQPLIYIGASDQAGMARRFERPHAITVRIAALVYLASACTAPLISAALLGRIEPGFIVFVVVLGAGSVMHTAGLTGQYGLTALGRFDALLRFAIVTAIANAVFGGIGLLAGGAVGAAAGLSLALVLHGALLLNSHARLAERPAGSQLGSLWLWSAIAALTGLGLALAASQWTPFATVLLSCAACLLLILPTWKLLEMFLHRSQTK